MYTFRSRVRYSEIDCDGRLSMEALLNYFQDCSTFQSEDLGVGIQYMAEEKQVWVMSSWQIVVKRYPRLSEEIVIGTLPYEFKGFLGFRNFFMETVDGEQLAVANSLWSLLDLATGKPTKPSSYMLDAYQLEEKLPMEYAPRKIVVPEQGRKEEPIVVKLHHLDTNHHVNNGQYVDMAMAYLPENFPVGQLRAEYKKQAFLNDILYPYVADTERDGKRVLVISLRDREGGVYVNVELEEK